MTDCKMRTLIYPVENIGKALVLLRSGSGGNCHTNRRATVNVAGADGGDGSILQGHGNACGKRLSTGRCQAMRQSALNAMAQAGISVHLGGARYLCRREIHPAVGSAGSGQSCFR